MTERFEPHYHLVDRPSLRKVTFAARNREDYIVVITTLCPQPTEKKLEAYTGPIEALLPCEFSAYSDGFDKKLYLRNKQDFAVVLPGPHHRKIGPFLSGSSDAGNFQALSENEMFTVAEQLNAKIPKGPLYT